MIEVKFRIEPRAREVVDQEVLQKASSGLLLLVSGTPLISYYRPEVYYNDNVHISDMPFKPYALSMINIPSFGHRHLDEKYLGSYPTLSGVNPETEIEYIFGIRPELDFKLLDI